MSEATRVLLRPLSMRDNGTSWVVGRMDTGDFVAMPPVGRRAIALLAEGCPVGQVEQVLLAETGTQIAVADFVISLDSLGFVAAIDGETRAEPAPPRPSLARLRPQHVRWLLHPVVAWLTAGVIAAAAVSVVADPVLTPRYRDLVWSPHAGLALVGTTVITCALVWLHELCHLATARAVDVPARITLSTRLQFLAAQTDVSGVWVAPRRIRLTVYLAGMAFNLLAAAICILTAGLAETRGLTRQLLAAVAMESLLMLPLQLLIFMRTDVYFVVQDLTGCSNLYADGSAHVRYLAKRAWHLIRRAGSAPPDPADDLGSGERRAVRAYSWVLLFGTTAALGAAVFVTVPAVIVLLARAVGELSDGSDADALDGAAALVIVACLQIVWLRTWWRRHGAQVVTFLRGAAQRSAGRR